MGDPLLLRGKTLSWKKCQDKHANFLIKNSGILFAAIILTIFGSVFRFWSMKPVFYAQAYTGKAEALSQKENAALKCEKPDIFENKENEKNPVTIFGLKKEKEKTITQDKFAEKLYEMVGSTPIREMIPFISKRDEKVAAFLVGIAKKESSWGEHVPLQDGKDCYNYWGYKGSASRGNSMGYACFADAKEAVEVVGNRLEVLINKNHTTASKMLVWKCGASCAGHSPEGVQSWVATVAMYFDKIVG
jgi:hypothetical protein